MLIEVYADGLEKEDINKDNYRTGCRGIIKKDNKILIVHLEKLDVFVLPGGGLEDGETLEECVIREVLEETGYLVKVKNFGCKIKEYFVDSTWESNFFLCEVVENCKTKSLTKEEESQGLISKWIDFEEYLSILSSYESKHPNGENVHQRELLGIINTI